MALPTDTFAAANRPGFDHQNGCDRCGTFVHADAQWYCEWTGEALCDACSGLRDQQEAEFALEGDFRREWPIKAARIEELERLLTFANDTNELLLTQLRSAQDEIAQALTLALRGAK